MEYINKLNEFGQYLLTINNDESKKLFINDILIKCRYQDGLVSIKLMRQESDDDNSQLNEWLSVYGLEDNEDNRLKLKEYLEYFLSVQEFINV